MPYYHYCYSDDKNSAIRPLADSPILHQSYGFALLSVGGVLIVLLICCCSFERCVQKPDSCDEEREISYNKSEVDLYENRGYVHRPGKNEVSKRNCILHITGL